MSAEAVEVIRRANAAFNAGDNEAMLSLLHPEMEFVDHMPLPDVGQTASGKDEMEALVAAWRQGFVGFQADIQEYLDVGEFVVCDTSWRFVSRDEGIELEWHGAEAWEVRDGKIIWGQAGFRDKQRAIEAVEARAGGALPTAPAAGS